MKFVWEPRANGKWYDCENPERISGLWNSVAEVLAVIRKWAKWKGLQ